MMQGRGGGVAEEVQEDPDYFCCKRAIRQVVQ